MPYGELLKAGVVSAGTEVCEQVVPANGKAVHIYVFQGEAAFTTNAAVKLIWDLDGAGEEIIWSTKGSSSMPFTYDVVGDGTKKLAVCLDNGESGDLIMSGHAEYFVED